MNKLLRWLACVSLAAGCGFGDNQLASRVATPDPVCGDGVVDSNESCDDGNAHDNDGCSSTCAVETPSAECGNGVRENAEACDDGNVTNGDGCSSACKIEIRCGDGDIGGTEECDDGNTHSGDGCSSTCDVESTLSCTLVPQSGCSGATPACDVTIEGEIECRAVTALGTSNSHCSSPTACKAGYTCAGDSATSASCTRLCQDDGDCTGSGSRCVVSFEGDNGPLPAQGCSNACDPYGQTGCPSGMDCMAIESSEGDYTDCAYLPAAQDFAPCTTSYDCAEGWLCAPPNFGQQKYCGRTCVIGGNACPNLAFCEPLPGHIIIGSVEYGVCH